MLPDIRGFIFDLDGVLTDTAEYHYRAWQRLADEEGIPFDRARNEALRGVSRRESLDLLLAGRAITEDQAEEMMERKNRYYRDMISQLSPKDLLPGAVELLDEIRAAGLLIAIASASKNARDVVVGLGIGGKIDAIADGYSVSQAKPAPDLFLFAARELGLPPQACVVVEDAQAGVEAGLAAGMWVVGLGDPTRVGRAQAVFESLDGVHLKDILDALAKSGVPSRGPGSGPAYRAALHGPGAEVTSPGTSILDSGLGAGENWRVREPAFDPARQHAQETVFTIGNGYLGTRGTFEEGYPEDLGATFVHGIFDDAPIVFSELANIPNWLPVTILIEGHPFRLDQGRVLHYDRWLDLRNGVLHRTIRWQAPAGQTVDLDFERFASLADKYTLAIRVSVTALDFSGIVEVRASLNGHVDNLALRHWNILDQGNPEPQQAWLRARTRASGVELAEAMQLQVSGCPASYTPRDCEGQPGVTAHMQLSIGESAQVDKYIALFTSRDSLNPQAAALVHLQRIASLGYDELRHANDQQWGEVWQSVNITIEGDDRADRAVRCSLFSVLIAAPREDERVSIGAKTLSGYVYRGHVFWDTDIFCLPLFALSQPDVARNLLAYRYHTLPGARRKALAAGYEGAMYAWESTLTGDEMTPRWVQSWTGQMVRIWCGDIELHISCDVAYAVMRYWQWTGDDTFMIDYGAEIVLDTAVFWGSRAEHDAEADQYHFRDVIGPDEYHDHVDDNAFTNAMVRWHLQTALEVLDWLRQHAPGRAEELVDRLKLTQERLDHWRDVRDKIRILQDPHTHLMEQFEGFFQLDSRPASEFEPRTRSLQVLLGIEGVQKHQLIKQPDVLMLHYLLSDRYGSESLVPNYEYYTPRTDHTYGSSLGPAIQAILACWMGRPAEAYEHFMRAALVDLEDVRGNTAEGAHAASAGGVWQAIVFGFAGVQLQPDGYHVRPSMPPGWRRLRFPLIYRGQRIEVDIPGTMGDQ